MNSFVALITPLGTLPVDPGFGKPSPIDPGYGVRPPVDPGYGVPAPPPHPEHPIVIPPDAIAPGVPTHPIYIPVYPAHPIVIPPDAVAPGVPTHPIVLPPYVPAHPIVIPPDAISPGVPAHPIVLPPPPHPEHPIPPRPEHPIVLPPGSPVPPNADVVWPPPGPLTGVEHPITIVPPGKVMVYVDGWIIVDQPPATPASPPKPK